MVSIIIPTYNERENIIGLINAIKTNLDRNNIRFEIIVVDDNSPDGTYIEALHQFQKHSNIRLFQRKKIRGLASAILFGINKAKGNIIVSMDADFNHPPETIIELINELNNNDLVVASRFIKGGGMEDKIRYIFTYIFNLFLKYILGFPTMDNMSGFYTIKKEKLNQLPINKIYTGYGEYHLRLVYLAKKQRLEIKEIPVFYPKRKYGQSKSNLFKGFSIYLWTAINLRINTNFSQKT